MTKKRLLGALASFALLAVIALIVLQGPFRTIVLILIAALAVKSWIGYKKEQL
jgi:hypothetical protein